MKRKFLEDMGLEKEQVDKILDENSQDIGKAKGDSEKMQKDLDAANAEIETLKGQVSDRDKQLETLKNSTGDVEAMKQQIETLQQQNADQKKTHDAEMAQLKLDNAVDAALTAAGAKNAKTVKALIDLSKVKLDEDGKLTGWEEQLSAVQKSDSYLFEAKQQGKNDFKGFQPGASGKSKPGTEVDMSKMTYEELANYIENNPDAE